MADQKTETAGQTEVRITIVETELASVQGELALANETIATLEQDKEEMKRLGEEVCEI